MHVSGSEEESKIINVYKLNDVHLLWHIQPFEKSMRLNPVYIISSTEMLF